MKGGGWVDDPDWLGDFTLDEPEAGTWGVTGIRRGSGHPMKNIAVYITAVDAAGAQVAGQATVRGFIINKGEGYDLPPGVKGIRHAATAAVALNFIDPFVITVGKHSKMGVRLTNIVSASGVEIRIAVQEIQ